MMKHFPWAESEKNPKEKSYSPGKEDPVNPPHEPSKPPKTVQLHLTGRELLPTRENSERPWASESDSLMEILEWPHPGTRRPIMVTSSGWHKGSPEAFQGLRKGDLFR
jgi:hypothetical protein